MMMQQQQQQHHGNGSSDRGSALEPSEPPEEDFNQHPKEDASDTPAADDENRKDCITIAMANGRHPTSYADAVMNGSILDTPMTNLAMDSPASKQQQQQQHSALPPSPHGHLDQQVQVHLSQEQQYHQQHHDYHLQEHHCQYQPHHNTHGYGASPSSPHAALGQPSTPASPSILPQCYPQQSEEAKESHHQLNHTDQSSTQYQTTHNPYSASSQTGGEGTEEKIPQTNYAAINSNGCPHGISVNQYHGDDGDSNNDGRMSVVSERAMSIVSERATTPMVMSTMAEDDFMIQDVLYEDTNNMNNKGGEAADVIHGGNADEASSPESGIETENEQSRKQSQNTESTGAIDEQCRNTEGIGGVNISPNNSEYTRITQPTASTTQTNNTPNSDNGSNTAADTGMGATLAVQAQREADKYSTPGTTAMKQRPTLLSKELLRSPEHTIDRLSYILGRGTLVMINFSQRSLGHGDAELLRSAIIANPQLGVLKLGYNNLGDIGASLIASAINGGKGAIEDDTAQSFKSGDAHYQEYEKSRQHHHHHPSLSVLDLGFNNVGDIGCSSLATLAVARNPALSTLYLSGNAVREQGALALAEAVAGGCGLKSLHLTANRIGGIGVKGLMRSIAEFDVTVQMAQQDRENRMALEEEKKKLRESPKGKLGSNELDGGGDENLDSLGDKDGEDEPDDLARLHGFKCMEELYLGGTNMGSTGCLSVSNMLLTNLSLRVLCLSDNGLNDQDLSLFSQSISRNRQLPIETLRLSFNRLTCVGVETLMNAIWESKTLREIKLDNNQIRDRGAQLAAVVLTSVDLEVLDLGFNRLTIVGIKALMKSLAENCSLLTLTLSGNVLDTNASKAVSYALAYNRTIRKLYVDHCSLSYAAQRHIAAGIVSNSNLALRVMSGFPLGAISVTLGLPGAMENWTNEQVLKFIRVMWDRYGHENEHTLLACKESSLSVSTGGASESSVNAASAKSSAKAEKVGPSDPATVVAAAKSAFAALGDAGGALLMTEEPQRAISETSPVVSSDAVMLEKTASGTVRVPPLDDSDEEVYPIGKTSIKNVSTDSLCTANGKDCPETPMDPVTKKRNMEWLRLHFRSLNGMIQLPYVQADLLQLYRYFYSPVDADEEGSTQEGTLSTNKIEPNPSGENSNGAMPSTIFTTETHPANSPSQSSFGTAGAATSFRRQIMPGLQRKDSYRALNDVMMTPGINITYRSPNFGGIENSCRRRPVSALEGCNQYMQPALKRARNDKPRIDYFPRIKAKIEHFLSSSCQSKALVLLRQLKFVETMLFRGVNPYHDQSMRSDGCELVATDAEVILIDML